MNEEYMCNYCSEGIIRPLQCNLNEAVLLCNNIDCDFYLQDIPQNCLISKPILNHLVTLKSSSGSNEYCVPSRLGTSSLSPVASSSSSTDREVELLLNRSYSGCELPAIHSNFQSCHSLHNSINQEFSAELDGNRYCPGDMTHSKFFYDFYGTQHHVTNNSYDAAAVWKKDEEELNEMLNDGKISKSEATETILDEALASWLQDVGNLPLPTSYESTLQTSKNESMNQLPESTTPITIIPSGKSAFSEIHPRITSKLSKDLNSNMSEANFLSPVGSGISEDSGYNEEEILRGSSKSTKTMFLTPLKNTVSQNIQRSSEATHCISSSKLNNSTCSDRSFPCLSMSNLLTLLELKIDHDSNYQDISQVSDQEGYKSNFVSTVPDVDKNSLHIRNKTIENMCSSDNLSNDYESNTFKCSPNLFQNMSIINDKEELGTASNTANFVKHFGDKSPTLLKSELQMPSYKKSSANLGLQFKKSNVSPGGSSKFNLVSETINGDSDSIKIQPPKYLENKNIPLPLETSSLNVPSACLEANDETSYLSGCRLPCMVPIKKLNGKRSKKVQSGSQDSCLENYISINNELPKVENCVRNLKKICKKGQIEIDPWSVPEIYLDELNIEVTLDDQRKKGICKNNLDQLENVRKSEDKHIESKINYPKIPEAENLQNVTIFRPISLRPEVINLKDFPSTTICSSECKEPVRLSVGLLSPRKDLCINNPLNDINNTERKLANSSYFDSLLSSCVFDESFLHTRAECKENGFENLSNNFLEEWDAKEKQHICINKIKNEEIINPVGNNKDFNEGSESELTIISVDANDEPCIYYRPGKRKFGEEIGCTDGKRKKVCATYEDHLIGEYFTTASKNSCLSEYCKSDSLNNEKSILSNKNDNSTLFEHGENLACQNEVSHVKQQNGIFKSHICLDSQQLKSNMALVINRKINNLRQRVKFIDSKITLQNTSYNYREINSQFFVMSYEIKNYGNIKEDLVQFSDFKNISKDEEESSFLNPSSKDDLGFLGILNENQDILVEECEPSSNKLSQFWEDKVSPHSLFRPNTRPYVNKNKCYKCHGKQILSSEDRVENSGSKVSNNIGTLSLEQDKEIFDYKQCIKVSVPKYMNSSFHNSCFHESCFKEIPKRKYIDKFTSRPIESKPICDKKPPVLDSNPSELNVLEFLKKSGWAVTECSPLINYQGPSNAISPTIIPPALQNQYGKTGSDVVLWTMTDDKLYKPKVSSTPVNIDLNNECGKQESTINHKKTFPYLNLVKPYKNCSSKIVKVPEPKLKFSNAAIKDSFLVQEKKIVRRPSSLSPQNKKISSTHVGSKNSNLTTLKIGSNNTFLPPVGIVKKKTSVPNDNLAYDEVASDGFYKVKAPSNEHSCPTYSTSDNLSNFPKKKQIFKRMPSNLNSNLAIKKEIKHASSKTDCQLNQPSSSSESQLLQSNLPSLEFNHTQKLAEDTLISTINNSGQVPLFLCVAHNDKTIVFHRKEYKES